MSPSGLPNRNAAVVMYCVVVAWVAACCGLSNVSVDLYSSDRPECSLLA